MGFVSSRTKFITHVSTNHKDTKNTKKSLEKRPLCPLGLCGEKYVNDFVRVLSSRFSEVFRLKAELQMLEYRYEFYIMRKM